MEFNKNFAKSPDGVLLEFAPREFDFSGVHYNATNSEEIYRELGYLRLVLSKVPEKEGFYYTDFYEEEENLLVQKWKEHEISDFEEKVTVESIKKAIAEGVNGID